MSVSKLTITFALALVALSSAAIAGAAETHVPVLMELDTNRRIESVLGRPLPEGPLSDATNELDAYRSFRLSQTERMSNPMHKLIHGRWHACTHDLCTYELAERESLLMRVHVRGHSGDTALISRVEGALIAARPDALDARGNPRNIMMTDVLYSMPLNALRAVVQGAGE